MRKRDGHRTVVLVPCADTFRDALDPEQPSRRETADGHDQLRADQPQLVVAPVLAKPLLLRRRGAIAAARRGPPGIAPRDRRAVERAVEGLLVHLEPPPQCLAGAAAPRPTLLTLDDARGLAEQVRALPTERGKHRPRLQRIARLGAGAARALITLHRRQRAIGDAPASHSAERTTTNHIPSKRTSPPPSSSARPAPVK